MSKTLYDYVLKFIIVGDSTVGKSNIMSRYTDKKYQATHDTTIGVEFATKIISISKPIKSNKVDNIATTNKDIKSDKINNIDTTDKDKIKENAKNNDTSSVIYKMQIWDTAGQEVFKSITRSYYRGTVGCLLVYDIVRRESFDSVNTWLKELREYCDPNIVVALVGNKLDLDSDNRREISYEEGYEFAIKNNLLFFETSARTGKNVETCFTEVVQVIQNKLETNEIILIKNQSAGSRSTIKLVSAPPINKSNSWGSSCGC